MALLLINQDARRLAIRALSIHMIILSPPYKNVRDYQTGKWEGGDPDCPHKPNYIPQKRGISSSTLGGGKKHTGHAQEEYANYCPRCGAIRSDEQLGQEPLHDCMAWARGEAPCGNCYVCNLRAWGRECYRVLRNDGTLWLNIADSYNGSGGAGGDYGPGGSRDGQPKYKGANFAGLKPKDMMGIPWRSALALQADGWYLRASVIWHKPNPMPESATDRPNRDYEYVFMLSKSERYYFDMEAVRVKSEYEPKKREFGRKDASIHGREKLGGNMKKGKRWEDNPAGRHLRSVWTIQVSAYGGEHYATYPPELVIDPLKASTSEYGVCPKCGMPWNRIIERVFTGEYNTEEAQKQQTRNAGSGGIDRVTLGKTEDVERRQLGWLPGCTCYRTRNPEKLRRQELQAPGAWEQKVLALTENYAGNIAYPYRPIPASPAIVLDPFNGSGTTLEVSRQLGRHGVGGDISYQYLVREAKERLNLAPLERWVSGKPKKTKAKKEPKPIPMFEGL